MNRRSFLAKLAVGVVAAPTIVKALASDGPYRCVITPVEREFVLRSREWKADVAQSFDEGDAGRLYADAIAKQMARTREAFVDQILTARAKYY